MHQLFHPKSIVIWGLSTKSNNIPRLILENLLRWGFQGRLFGIHPKHEDNFVDGVKIYKDVSDLPEIPDLAVFLLPARHIPDALRSAGKFGIKRAAVLSGGFNEAGKEGKVLAEKLVEYANEYGMRFIGPNGLTVANTSNGLCLPFTPIFSPPKGGMSIITQSGGMGVFLWNLMSDENIGMAKFASIGNKLNISETDCIEYFGEDPETKVICLYLESITNGRELIKAAEKINKPVIVFKANTTSAGNKAAMSHTAAISNNEEIINSAFKRAGIIRIDNFSDFIDVAKAFELPPLRGDNVMVMSPAGGFTVVMADLCEEAGFNFADPGQKFYDEVNNYTNAGVINLSNPLDLGDVYNAKAVAEIICNALHNKNVDGVFYITQNPHMPKSDDVFYKMFKTDISKETIGGLRSSGKPLATTIFAPSKTINKMKKNLTIPIFNTPESMIKVFKKQRDFYAKKEQGPFIETEPENINKEAAANWLANNPGVVGEEALELLATYGIKVSPSIVTSNEKEALAAAEKIGYPVVMKVVSPQAIHKSEAGGVLVNIKNDTAVREGFATIKSNLINYNKDAEFKGVRIMPMAKEGHDMFVGGNVDDAFGPVAFFGYGGIYIEVFKDVKNVLCPSNPEEIEANVKKLASSKILEGTRGASGTDIQGYIDLIHRVTQLMADFPQIKELDLNPVRILADGSGVMALDARIRNEKV